MRAGPIRLTVARSVLAAAAMFAFAVFLMPPLYNLLCEITGVGSRTLSPTAQPVALQVDESRSVRVQFVATNNAAMPWEFSPLALAVDVHPGQPTTVRFHARNPTGKDMVAQAIPNITPANATRFLHKTECFCFNRQPLGAGESTDMAVVFFLDPDLPRSVETITLSYTLFDVTDRPAPPPVAVTTVTN